MEEINELRVVWPEVFTHPIVQKLVRQIDEFKSEIALKDNHIKDLVKRVTELEEKNHNLCLLYEGRIEKILQGGKLP